MWLADMTIGERIKQWRESLGWSQDEAAAKTGTTLRTFARYERGENEPKASFLQALAALGVNLGWLVAGIPDNDLSGGDLGNDPTAREHLHLGQVVRISNQEDKVSTPQVRLTFIEAYKLSLSAGHGASLPEHADKYGLYFSADFIERELRRAPENLHIVFATGDSMQSTINDGDMLMIDHTDTEVISGRVYALQVGEDLLVKRLRKGVTGDVMVVSDNPAYPTEPLPKDNSKPVRIIGRVVWHSARPT